MDVVSITLTEAELKEQEERNAITELLYAASRGSVVRMQMTIAHRRLDVRLSPHSHSACEPPHSLGMQQNNANCMLSSSQGELSPLVILLDPCHFLLLMPAA